MSKSLSLLLALTDLGFILYWTVPALMALDLVHIPADVMYADASNPRVIAWNWSFFPLDIAFSIMGLMAVRAARAGDPRWRAYALISLVLTMTAGGMAVSYWVLLGEIDPFWVGTNLALVIWPLFFLPGLVRSLR